ncbi:hypothetical protein ACES2I_08890 [Bdellovibrio bacteriovorus]|uniref:hypothetical protein n=1 Tax=Bdellovibrio bacteriovorus TaxID=959 RepID=UPI0035A5DD10
MKSKITQRHESVLYVISTFLVVMGLFRTVVFAFDETDGIVGVIVSVLSLLSVVIQYGRNIFFTRLFFRSLIAVCILLLVAFLCSVVNDLAGYVSCYDVFSAYKFTVASVIIFIIFYFLCLASERLDILLRNLLFVVDELSRIHSKAVSDLKSRLCFEREQS